MQQSGRYSDEIASFARARVGADLHRLMEERAREESPDPIEAALTTSEALFSLVTRSVADALELLTLAQYTVLASLEGGPLTTEEIARCTGSSTRSASQALATLTDQGWVSVASPLPTYQLSAHGEQLVAHSSARRRADLTEILDSMPRRDRAAVAHAFAVFARVATEPRPGVTS